MLHNYYSWNMPLINQNVSQVVAAFSVMLIIGVQVFSKLDTGRLPDFDEIINGIGALVASKQQ